MIDCGIQNQTARVASTRNTPCWMKCVQVAVAALITNGLAAAELLDAKQLYEKRCAQCHGKQGEGTAEHFPRSLTGDRSLAQLIDFVARAMPPDMPGSLSGQEAEQVATYIFAEFYSPEAQASRASPKVATARLTARQHASAIADLMVSFFGPSASNAEQGLRGNYAAIDANGDGKQVLSRIDPQIQFDFGMSSPKPGEIDPAEFSIIWIGSILAPTTGEYEFIVRCPNRFQLFVNQRKTPLIDAWVKSGDQTEYRGAIRLLAGRWYRLQLNFTKAGQGVKKPEPLRAKIAPAAISLAWKPPGRGEELIPARSLSPREVRETLVLGTPFPADDRSTGFERGTAVSPEWDRATTNAAIEAAVYVRERVGDYCGVVEPDRQHEPALKEFCGRFAERAFRRPLTPELRALYVDRQFERAPDVATALERVVLMVLKSPRFLYVDLSDIGPDSYQTATRLSLILWDSLPEDVLLAAAATGQLSSREQIAAQARRMTADPRFDAKLREFLMAWLKIDHSGSLAKSSAAFPEFDAATAIDLRTSLELFLDDILADERGDFRRLLLADDLYLNGRLASVYGDKLSPDAPFQRVTMPPNQRAGVLTHPYLMAVFAGAEESSPIRRGAFVARSLLGRTLRPPADAVTPDPPSLHPGLTTRERTARQTNAQACQSCHSLINPLGFAFEQFDAIGRFRESESSRPIDATGSYLSRANESTQLDGARQLAEFLAGSNEVHEAFVEKLFYYCVKQPIRAFGPDALPALLRELTTHDFSIRHLMVEIAVTAALPRTKQTFPPENTVKN